MASPKAGTSYKVETLTYSPSHKAASMLPVEECRKLGIPFVGSAALYGSPNIRATGSCFLTSQEIIFCCLDCTCLCHSTTPRHFLWSLLLLPCAMSSPRALGSHTSLQYKYGLHSIPVCCMTCLTFACIVVAMSEPDITNSL